MSKHFRLYGVLIILLISSCSSYTKFYSKTVTQIDSNTSVFNTHRLDLSHQNLTELPKEVTSLRALKMLDLTGNYKLDLDKIFNNLPFPNKLEILILDSLSITELPKSILRFKKLKQLSLAYNPDLELDKTLNLINNLPLSFLNLKGNKINKLPSSISSLIALRDLNLSDNKLSDDASYQYLGKLPKLYSVWLDHNNLNQLPSTLGALNQIRYLYVDHNNLSEFPKELPEMSALWVIHAGYNKFTELPKELVDMKSLLMIHINNNNISHIPEEFETKKATFKGLLLDNNPISLEEERRARKLFKGFFLLSFQQKKYPTK